MQAARRLTALSPLNPTALQVRRPLSASVAAVRWQLPTVARAGFRHALAPRLLCGGRELEYGTCQCRHALRSKAPGEASRAPWALFRFAKRLVPRQSLLNAQATVGRGGAACGGGDAT
eukprot:tig00020510_g9846.t1